MVRIPQFYFFSPHFLGHLELVNDPLWKKFLGGERSWVKYLLVIVTILSSKDQIQVLQEIKTRDKAYTILLNDNILAVNVAKNDIYAAVDCVK